MSGAVGVVLTIFILMGVGILLTHIGWIGDGASSFLSKFVVKVALTATVIQNMFGKFTAESLKSMAAGLVLPFAAIAIVMCLGILIAKRLHMPQNRFGAFVCTFTFSNSVFIGLPVCNALFGEDSATYTLIYYIANTVMFWSAGYALMRRDGGVQKEERSFLSIPAYLLAKDKNDERYVPAKNALFFLSKTVPLPLLAMILSEFGISIHVKWPNDLVLTLPKLNTFCKKVGGILLEEKNGRLLMGLGLNIASAPDSSLLREKTALAAGCIPASVVQSVQITCLTDLWLHIVGALRQLMEDGIARNWRYLAEARLLGRGELADVCDGPDEAPVVHGRILGLDDSGGIRINTGLGVRTCTSGSLLLQKREEEL